MIESGQNRSIMLLLRKTFNKGSCQPCTPHMFSFRLEKLIFNHLCVEKYKSDFL